MSNSKNQHTFLIILLIASVVFVFFIVKPLLISLLMAAVFAFLFQPIYKKFNKWTRGRNSVAAFLVTALSIFILIIPISLLGFTIFKEATELYQGLEDSDSNIAEQVSAFFNNIKASLPLPANTELNLNQYISKGLEAITNNIGAIFSSFFSISLSLFVFLISFYYLLKDGANFSKYLIRLIPLEDKDNEFIVERIKSAIQATVKGNLTIGLIQGTLTGIGFAIFGVPNPVLWASITAIAALIPGIGTTIVIAPAVIYLFASGSTYNAIGLAIWGITAVGLIDNMLGPKLIGKNMQLHPLAIFISVLGGIIFFGPLGFIIGPLVLSICIALIDIYLSIKKSKNI